MLQTPDPLKLIFERWKASLRDRKRSAEHVLANFDDLFQELSAAGATFEEAYEILPAAIKAHQPPPATIRSFWKLQKSRIRNFDTTEKELAEKWCNDIADQGTNSFYAIFPAPTGSGTQSYSGGKISEKEYKQMRAHADRFRPLDLSTLPDPSDDLMTDEDEIWNFIKERMRNG